MNIKKVSCQISKSLHDEIKSAQKTLNSIEYQKCIGKRKKKYTFLETSEKVGKYLFSQRKIAKSNSFEDLF